jgi:hypothetical protein
MRWALSLSVFVASAACGASLSFTRTDGGVRATQPRGPVQVELFTTGRPLRPNVELGVMESDRGSSRDEDAQVLAKMREYAGELGCDALVLLDEAAGPHRGSCLIYTAPPMLAPPPASTGNVAPAACLPNVAQACFGANGCRGMQTCSTDGKSYSPCACGAQ